MSKSEVIKILMYLAVNYESIDKKLSDNNKKDVLVNVWYSCLKDIDYSLCGKACQKHMLQSDFPPTVHNIREEVLNILSTEEKTNIDYWNEAYNMICNGLYMTQEQFELSSYICQRYFGSVERVREKAKTENLNMEVEQSNFNKVAQTLQKQKRQQELLPEKMREEIQMLADKMSASRLIGGVK
mgnify:FL=1